MLVIQGDLKPLEIQPVSKPQFLVSFLYLSFSFSFYFSFPFLLGKKKKKNQPQRILRQKLKQPGFIYHGIFHLWQQVTQLLFILGLFSNLLLFFFSFFISFVLPFFSHPKKKKEINEEILNYHNQVEQVIMSLLLNQELSLIFYLFYFYFYSLLFWFLII